MTLPLPSSVILSEAADHLLSTVILSEAAHHEVNDSAVEGPRACVQPHGPRTEFSLGPDLVALR
jgi:hypothetical protein